MNQEPINVKLVGGLGNQLFIWATATAISKRTGLRFNLDATQCTQWGYQLGDFRIEAKYLAKSPPDGLLPTRLDKHDSRLINFLRHLRQELRKFRFGQNHWERSNSFDSSVFKIRPGKTLCGYFQSYKYFDSYAIEIRDFLLNNFKVTPEFDVIYKQFEGSKWVAIDFRRQDYERFSDTFGLVGENYYQAALAFLSSEFPNLKKIVFSDDVLQAKMSMPNCDGYIGNEQLKSSAARLILMSKADAIIGSNSTFGWWAAYLSEAQDRFKIFPDPWFKDAKINPKDLVPLNWTRIKNK
jgi:hypothetical protein